MNDNENSLKTKLSEFILNKIPNIRKYPLKYVFENINIVKKDGLWLEFGVYSGRTINYISKQREAIVHGFDSFEGLPEKWRDGFDKGRFNRRGRLPEVNDNVTLIKGWFDKTLVPFLKTNNETITFIHIDCDLYSSTIYVLETLKKKISNGCVIVFDELVNYPGYLGNKGELRALYEFIKNNEISFEWIGMNGFVGLSRRASKYEKVAIRITNNPFLE